MYMVPANLTNAHSRQHFIGPLYTEIGTHLSCCCLGCTKPLLGQRKRPPCTHTHAQTQHARITIGHTHTLTHTHTHKLTTPLLSSRAISAA